jgi:hypothetical protein
LLAQLKQSLPPTGVNPTPELEPESGADGPDRFPLVGHEPCGSKLGRHGAMSVTTPVASAGVVSQDHPPPPSSAAHVPSSTLPPHPTTAAKARTLHIRMTMT